MTPRERHLRLSRICLLLACAAACCVPRSLPAQQDGESQPPPQPASDAYARPAPPSLGFFFDVTRNLHTASFKSLPGVPGCCPEYREGFGTALTAGALYEQPLTPMSGLQLRVAVAVHDALLSADEHILLPDTGSGGGVINGVIRHDLDSRISTVEFEPLFVVRVAGGLCLLAGGSVGLVTRSSYRETETIVSPAVGVFVDSRYRTRFIGSGEIPSASHLAASLTAGVAYRLPLDAAATVSVLPELLCSLGLTNVVRDLDWKINTFRAGVAVIFSLPGLVP